jgi:hypothetical protein
MLSKIKAVANLLRTGRTTETGTPPSNVENNLELKPVDELKTIDQQQAKTNEEDFTIVWLTKDTKNTKEQTLIRSLRSINNYIQVKSFNEY